MIKFYSSNDDSTYLDTSGSRNYFDGHNKRNNNHNIHQIYFRNTATNEWCSNIYISSTSTQISLNKGSDGFGLKFYYGSLEPTERVWSGIGYNEPIFINNIGTSGSADTSFKSFYIRSEVSSYADVGMYDAQLKVSYVKHTV